MEGSHFLGVTVVFVLRVSGHTGFKWSLFESMHESITKSPVVFQEKRLRDRKTESEENLQKRLTAAKNEIEFSKYLGILLQI